MTNTISTTLRFGKAAEEVKILLLCQFFALVNRVDHNKCDTRPRVWHRLQEHLPQCVEVLQDALARLLPLALYVFE